MHGSGGMLHCLLVPATRATGHRAADRKSAGRQPRSPIRLRAWVLWGFREASPLPWYFYGSGAVLCCAPLLIISWSRTHGLGPTVSDLRSRTHGLGPTVPDTWSRTHGLGHSDMWHQTCNQGISVCNLLGNCDGTEHKVPDRNRTPSTRFLKLWSRT